MSVASSDSLIQLSALRQGTRRISAAELEMDISIAKTKVEEIIARHSNPWSKLGDRARIRGDLDDVTTS